MNKIFINRTFENYIFGEKTKKKSVSVISRGRSANPDPDQNETDPQQW